ncbi:riboflavin synthase, partial [Bacillus sp. HC-Mk]
ITKPTKRVGSMTENFLQENGFL